MPTTTTNETTAPENLRHIAYCLDEARAQIMQERPTNALREIASAKVACDRALAQLGQLDEAEETRRGELLGRILMVPVRNDNDRFETLWGDKTDLGLFRTAQRIIQEGK